MTTGSDMDRRRIERIHPDFAPDLEVTLDTADRTYHDGIVVNMSIGGVCLRYRRDRGAVPNLTPGEVVSIGFTSNRSEMNVQVPAKIMTRADEPEYKDFRCVFDPGHTSFLEEQLIADMFRLFNRRASGRVTPEQPLAVAIRVSHETDALDTSIHLREVRDVSATARLQDVSANGVAVVCDESLDRLLETAAYVETRFALPDTPGPLTFVCKLLNRRVEEDRYYHGMCFEVSHTRDFETQKKLIVDYIGRARKKVRES